MIDQGSSNGDKNIVFKKFYTEWNLKVHSLVIDQLFNWHPVHFL